MNCVVNGLADGFARRGAELVADLHGPGGLDVGNGEMDGFTVGGEIGVADDEKVFVVMLGAVIGSSFEAPDFYGVVGRFFGFSFIERIGEMKADPIVERMKFERKVERFTGRAYAV